VRLNQGLRSGKRAQIRAAFANRNPGCQPGLPSRRGLTRIAA